MTGFILKTVIRQQGPDKWRMKHQFAVGRGDCFNSCLLVSAFQMYSLYARCFRKQTVIHQKITLNSKVMAFDDL